MNQLARIIPYASSGVYAAINIFFLHRVLRTRRGAIPLMVLYYAAVTFFGGLIFVQQAPHGTSAVFTFVSLALYSFIFLDGSVGECILIPAFGVSLQGATDKLVSTTFALILSDGFSVFQASALFPIIGTVVSGGIYALIIHYLCKMRWYTGALDSTTSLFICAMPISSFLMIMMFQKHFSILNGVSTFEFLAIAALCTISLFSIMVYNRLSANVNALVDTKAELQATQTKLSKEQELQYMHKSMAQIRHDYINHLIALDALAQEGSYDKLRTYSKSLLGGIHARDSSIKSGNTIIDAIINTKIFIARQSGIDFSVMVSFPGTLNIPDEDMTALLGNMLDNAVEAVTKLESTSRKVLLDVKAIKNIVLITCENPTDGNCVANGNSFLSTKFNNEQHGLGITAMQRIAKKYNGTFHVEHDNNYFTACAMLSGITTWNEGDSINISML